MTVRPVNGFSRCAADISASDAGFSRDGLYRWWLKRVFSPGDRTIVFVGLNPSRADAANDDPTLRRLMGFARQWGYHKLVVLNLFGWISPSPAVLLRARDPIGACNDAVLDHWLATWAATPTVDLWCGWGVNGGRFQRSGQVLQRLQQHLPQRRCCAPGSPEPLMLGLTASGHPRHPLYVPKQATAVPFRWAQTEVIRHPESTLTPRFQR